MLLEVHIVAAVTGGASVPGGNGVMSWLSAAIDAAMASGRFTS